MLSPNMKLFALFLLVKLLFHSGMHLLVWFLFDIITILILLCQTSDNKILSTVEKTFKTVNTWSGRLEIPSSEFVSSRFNGCMYEQCFRKVLKDNFDIIWVYVWQKAILLKFHFFFRHIKYIWHSKHAFCFCAYVKARPMSRDFKDLKYFFSLISIKKSSVANTFLFPFWRLYKYFDLTNLLKVFHRRFSISVYNV